MTPGAESSVAHHQESRGIGGMDSASMMRGGQPYHGHYGGMMPSKRGRKPLNLTNPNLHGNMMDNGDQGSASQSGINEGS